MTAIEFTFPAPAKLLNANQCLHHMARHRLTQMWRDAAQLHARSAVGPQIPTFERARIDVRIAFTVTRVRDIGNYYPTAKAIVDGLVDGRGKIRGLGVLPDDSDEYLDGPYLHNDGRTRGPVPVVTVRVTELEPAEAAS